MLKFVTSLSAALIVGWALVGSATTASAGGYGKGYGGKGCCGPLPPSYKSHTVYKHKHIKKYRDVWKHQYFKRYKKHIHVTKIQPIIHVHKVTRVHTKLIGVVVPVHKKITTHLPPKWIVTTSTVHLRPVCGCSSGGYGGGGYGKGGGYGY
jgi:hypothetical protein